MTLPVRIEPGIVTGDGAALAGFYCDALGFSVDAVLTFPQGVVRRLRRGDARLKLYEPGRSARSAPAASPAARTSGS